MQQAIAYYRVSTARQGRSGLGIEAQREVVSRFAMGEGIELAGEFLEVETGMVGDYVVAQDVAKRKSGVVAADREFHGSSFGFVLAKLSASARRMSHTDVAPGSAAPRLRSPTRAARPRLATISTVFATPASAASAVVGGTPLLGGRVDIIGTIFGCLIIGMINNGINLLGVSANFQILTQGVLILLALLADVQSTSLLLSMAKRRLQREEREGR